VGNTLFFKWAECVLKLIGKTGFIEETPTFTGSKLAIFKHLVTTR
jgi:hypothetical protein